MSAIDFNNDGKSDVAWRNVNDGRVAVWVMDGATIVSGTVSASIDSSWRVDDAADFTGDGKADLLWRNTDGRMALWAMDGGALADASFLYAAPTTWAVQQDHAFF